MNIRNEWLLHKYGHYETCYSTFSMSALYKCYKVCNHVNNGFSIKGTVAVIVYII